MSKVRNLTEITTLSDTDLFYAVDFSEANGGRKITLANLKTNIGLNSFKRGFLQYSNGSTATNTTTTYADIDMTTDHGSFINSLFTKTSSTQFRCDYAGYVRLSYKVNAFPNTNDRGVGVRITKNGTAQTFTTSESWGKADTLRSGSSSGTFIFACSINDYFTLQFANLEAAVTATISSGDAVLLVESYLVN
jgi:hypothetical protein